MMSKCRYCDPDTLDKKTGKWNHCPFTLGGGEPALVAGVTRSIMQDDRIKDFAFSFRLSASYLGMVPKFLTISTRQSKYIIHITLLFISPNNLYFGILFTKFKLIIYTVNYNAVI